MSSPAATSDESFWQRARSQWCDGTNPACKYTWLFSLLGILYVHIQAHCLPLLVRLVLHVGIGTGAFVALLRVLACHRLCRAARSPRNRERRARVVRTRTTPPRRPPCRAWPRARLCRCGCWATTRMVGMIMVVRIVIKMKEEGQY